MKHFLPFLLITLCGLINSPAVIAQKLYLLAGGDIHNETIGHNVHDGLTFFTTLFQDNVPLDQLVVYNSSDEWKGVALESSSNLNENLLAAIASCPVGQGDALLVFWFGYGSYFKEEFYLRDESVSSVNKISRADVVRAIKDKRSRFAAILTESGRMFRYHHPRDLDVSPPNSNSLTPLMQSLFFSSEGFLDLNSADRKQNPMIMPLCGGAFIEAFAEALKVDDSKEINWDKMILRCQHILDDNYKIPQQIEVFSNPRRIVPEEKEIDQQADASKKISVDEDQVDQDRSSDSHSDRTSWKGRSRSGAGQSVPRNLFSKRNDQDDSSNSLDWNSYSSNFQQRSIERQSQDYPQDYNDNPSSYSGGGYWSAPYYRPEAGDLLLGINGEQLLSYNQFLSAIARSPSLIYLTVADSWTGQIYELRTWMGPAVGQQVRLGLVVQNMPFSYGGLRISAVAVGSPAMRCQYRLGMLNYHYPIPIRRYYPVPYPVPYPPDPMPGPLPYPIPGPMPGPLPYPIPEPMPGPLPYPIPEPMPGPMPDVDPVPSM